MAKKLLMNNSIKVVEYKFTSSIDTMPDFNSDFEISDITDVSDGVNYTIRTIFASILPTKISFYGKFGLVELIDINTANVTDMSEMFKDCSKLRNLDLTNFNTSNVTDMSNMLNNCSNLTSLDLSSFDTSKVTVMNGMFNYCNKLTTLDLSNFNTSNVTNMFSMFKGCFNLTSLDLSSFDTSKVIATDGTFTMFTSVPPTAKVFVTTNKFTKTEAQCYFDGTFIRLQEGEFARYTFDKTVDANCIPYGCDVTSGYGITDISTSGNIVTRSLYATDKISKPTLLNFQGKSALKSIIKIDTSNITDMSMMFFNCSNLTSLDLSNFNTANVTNMCLMFNNCANLISLDVSNFNTSKVTEMHFMFNNCSNLTILDLTNFDTSNVNMMSSMFNNCNKLTDLDLSNFNTSNVTNMVSMFKSCSNLTSLDLSNFDTSKVTSMSGMFVNIPSTAQVFVTTNKYTKTEAQCYFDGTFIRLQEGEFARYTFDKTVDANCIPYGCDVTSGYGITDISTSGNIVTRSLYATDKISKPTLLSFQGKFALKSIIKIDTSNIADMNGMFQSCGVNAINMSSFNTSKVTDMSNMFSNAYNLTSLDLSSFDTSNVTDMSLMFWNCQRLTYLDVSNFDTSSVTKMSGMFNNCSSLTSLNVSNFDTSKVTNVYVMFGNCTNLTSLDVSNFDTSNAVYMYYMFTNCNKLTSLDLSSFNTSKVTNMSFMFNNCSNLTTLDLKEWDTSLVTICNNMFSNLSATETTIYISSKWTLTEAQTGFAGKFINADVDIDDIGINTIEVKITEDNYKIDLETTYLSTYDEMTDWGDGTIDALNSHIYINTGTYIINTQKWILSCLNTETDEIDIDSKLLVSNIYSLCNNNISFNYKFFAMLYVPELDLTNIYDSIARTTGMKAMFSCLFMNTIDLSKINTPNVTDMSMMFYNDPFMGELDCSSFDTSNVTNMFMMFTDCIQLTSLDVSSFNTSKVTNMNAMFSGCISLLYLDLSSFTVSSTTDVEDMFAFIDSTAEIRVGSIEKFAKTEAQCGFSGKFVRV